MSSSLVVADPEKLNQDLAPRESPVFGAKRVSKLHI